MKSYLIYLTFLCNKTEEYCRHIYIKAESVYIAVAKAVEALSNEGWNKTNQMQIKNVTIFKEESSGDFHLIEA